MRDINLIVIHCAATPAGLDIGARELDTMHKARGFHFDAPNPLSLKSLGYHYVIRLNGNVDPGRPEEMVGAHVQGHNAHSIGICLVGGLDASRRPADTYTPAQWTALDALVTELLGRYGDQVRVCGHRDLSPDKDGDGVIERSEWLKDCPCFDVAAWLDERCTA